ncbi:hypothetical protein [Burkholderia alba]|uniref:hypothetical protein n=1 Tax=Burkholderia alba TaxID=2683677 RepID=UPI002B059DB5|nr:hypothetical protein [Burkholderia alba]
MTQRVLEMQALAAHALPAAALRRALGFAVAGSGAAVIVAQLVQHLAKMQGV